MAKCLLLYVDLMWIISGVLKLNCSAMLEVDAPDPDP